MGKWLRSGRRRDMCYLLAAGGETRGQRLKSQLEARYDERIDPQSFYGSLSALSDAGLVAKRTDGIHDVYALTEAGERRLFDHYEWVRECLEES